MRPAGRQPGIGANLRAPEVSLGLRVLSNTWPICGVGWPSSKGALTVQKVYGQISRGSNKRTTFLHMEHLY
jgi:hypothetical protein